MALKPIFHPSPSTPEPPAIQSLISTLSLEPHIEGGYFKETDRDPTTIPSPFTYQQTATTDLAPQRPGFNPAIRNLSTSIFYLLTPSGPQGDNAKPIISHRNASRTIHTLHQGRGLYVLIHADEPGFPKRIETFIVGHDVAKGERLQWIVEGGKFKASFLLPDKEGGETSGGLLISETVAPGFEYCDHDFLTPGGLEELLGKEKAEELYWLLSPLGKQ